MQKRSRFFSFHFSTLELLLSFIILFSSNPYITHYLFGDSYVLISGGLSFLLFGIVIADCRGKMLLDYWTIVWGVFLLSFVIYGFVMYVYTGDLYDVRKSVGIITKLIFLYSTLLLIRRFYNQYLFFLFKSNIYIIVLSILLFSLLLGGISIPVFAFTKLDGREHLFYWIGATNVLFDFGFTKIIRIAGFADEPGAFALILSYLLVLNEFTYQNKKYRLICTIAGLLSFSMAFIISYIPILFYWLHKKIILLKTGVKLLFCSAVVIWISANADENIGKTIDALLFERFQVSESGTLKGDNRSNAFSVQLEGFVQNPILGVGTNPDYISLYQLGAPSLVSYLTTHGIYGLLFFYIPVICIVFKFRNSWKLLLLFSLALNYLQRPGIEDMFAMVVLSLIFYSNKYFSNEERN